MSLSTHKLPLLPSERKPRTPRRIAHYKGPSTPGQVAFGFDPGYNLRGLGDGASSIIWGSVMPSQLQHVQGWQSEKLLMAAVLHDAIKCVEYGRLYARAHRARRLGAEAEAWMRDEDVWWPYSFVNICLALGLDTGMVRSAVLGRRA